MITIVYISLLVVVASAGHVPVPLTLRSSTGCTDKDGRHYELGETVSTDPCNPCRCSKRGLRCIDIMCGPPSCADPVKLPGECCPSCPNGSNKRALDGERITRAKLCPFRFDPLFGDVRVCL